MQISMKEKGTIYSALCKVNNKRYIGQTVRNISERWKEHISDSRNRPVTPLHRAIAKYGHSMFIMRIIEEDVSIDNLDEREKHWITEFDTFHNGYNLTEGGQGGSRGELSEESRDRIRQAHFGKIKSPECIVGKVVDGMIKHKKAERTTSLPINTYTTYFESIIHTLRCNFLV
jgi:group I intron endonuclease